MTPSAAGDAGAAIRFGHVELWPRDRRLVVDGAPRPLGSRAFDMLVALAERPGRLVTKNELLDLVWPDLVVEENNLHVQMTQIRKALGNELIATIPGRGYRFVRRIDGDAPAPPQAAASAAAAAAAASEPPGAPRRVAAALGPDASALVGREQALLELHALTQAHRLVAVVGSGGIGKTSLVRRLLQEADAALDRVDFVELASQADPADVARTVSTALGLELGQADPAAALGAQLAPLKALVALDNVEHLADGVAAVVGLLLAAAPGLRIVVTSQVPLKVHGERVYRLEGLAVPESARAAAEAATHGAVVLFVDRAQAADRRFALTDDNVAQVVEICRRLDGVPLAIELAAARVPLLGLDGLVAALDERLRVLTGGHRDAPARQRTLRATLEWGHALLAASEQAVFRRLAVFAGSASLEAIRHVAADAPPGPLDEWAVLDALGALVDRSLVAVLADPVDPHAAPRYRLLESPRSLACEQLAASGEDDAVRRRHATWFVELAENHWAGVGADPRGTSRGVLALEHDNLRACLDWAAGHDVALGLRAAAALIPFWRERGYHADALRRCDALLAGPGVEVAYATRMRLSLGLCALAFEQGLPERLARYATEALERCRAQDDRSDEAACLSWLAHAVLFAGDRAGAIDRFRASAEAARREGDDRRAAESLTNVGCLLNEQGDAVAAEPLLREAMALYRRLDNAWGIGFATEILGEVAYATGDFEEARRCFQDSHAQYRGLQHQHRIASSLRLLACAEHRLGRLDDALAHVAQCLELAERHGFAVYLACALATAARIAITRDDPALAARLLGAAQAHMDRKSVRMEGPELAEQAAALAAAQAACGPRAWDEAWSAGRGMTAGQAAALARGGPPGPTEKGGS
jgi:predicted ATPase/DNA-binding winged helix-turn-helix (wHTH) protein